MATRKTKKQSSKSKGHVWHGSDHKDDPIFKLKPYDIVEYLPTLGDGNKAPAEIHVVCDTGFARDSSKISSWPTLRLDNGKLISDKLYCWGKDACEIKYLNNTHKLQVTIENGVAKHKLSKKRNNDKA